MGQPLLEVRNLKTWFKIYKGIIRRPVADVRAVDDVSFCLQSHEVLGIAGESGSGKTTIGRSILRLTEPTSGQILFNGDDVAQFDRRRLNRYRREAQVVFQDPYAALNARMTIQQILAEPLIIQKLTKGRRQRRDRVAELLETVNLPAEFMARRPHELSGGQRQRIVIARALAVEPKMIVADEPVSALDVSIQAQIIALLKDLKQSLGLSILFISHDLAVMEYLSNRIAVVYLGKLMEIGPARDLSRTPKHPYTKALLSAVPTPYREASEKRRIILSGDLPDPVSPPSGCVFRTRCPFAIEACAKQIPELRDIGEGRKVACIRDDVW